jgi:TRAP-type C4-dicarboxylate transport system permease small subunit
MGEQTNMAAASTAPPGGFARFNAGYAKFVRPIAIAGGSIGAGAIGIMMFLTFLDVAGRFIGGFEFIHNVVTFFGPIPGTTEITEFLMVLLVVFGIGYMALLKGHIRVDLILQYTSKKVTKIIDVYTYMFSFLMYALITWRLWYDWLSKYEDGTTSPVLNIQVYPFHFIGMIGAGILALVLLGDFLKSIEEVRK